MQSSHKSTHEPSVEDGNNYLEFRRKMKYLEVLSSSMEQLLRLMRFTGKLNIQVENGQVLKSQYEEGYFRRQQAVPLP